MTQMFKPKIRTTTPAPAPVVPKIEKPKRELGDEDARSEIRRKRDGRSSLRIEPQMGGTSTAAGRGINIPVR